MNVSVKNDFMCVLARAVGGSVYYFWDSTLDSGSGGAYPLFNPPKSTLWQE